MLKVVGNKGILGIIAIFIAVLGFGLLITIEAINTSSVYIISTTLANPTFSAFAYFLDFTLVLIILLIVMRRHRHYSNTLLFRVLEGIVTAFTSFFLFLLILTILFPHSIENGSVYFFSVALALLLILVKNMFHRLRNLATAVSSIGVGLLLGFNFPFGYAIFILAIVAVYDYICVFKTNEMISLAKTISTSNLAFLISVSDLEAIPRWGLSNAEMVSYMKYLEKTNRLDDPKFQKIFQSGKFPVVSEISLGEGDLTLPLMAVISAYYSFSQFLGMVVMLGSIAGIIATMLILKKYKQPIPAIPPLFSAIDIFVGVSFVFMNVSSFYYYFGALLIVASALTMLINILTITRKMHEIANKK